MNQDNTSADTASILFQLVVIIGAIGLLLVSSSAFACQVIPISVTLATQNTDGTPLTNATGQRLYYGQDPQNLSNKIDFGLVTSVQTPCLNDGKWYFAATTLTATDESARNTGAMVVVSTPVPPTGKELCLVDGISSPFTRPVYAKSASGSRGTKLGDLFVGPVQPVGLKNPVSSISCSCTDFFVYSSNPYALVSYQGKPAYVAACKTHGVQP